MPYLEAAIEENLRMYSPVVRYFWFNSNLECFSRACTVCGHDLLILLNRFLKIQTDLRTHKNLCENIYRLERVCTEDCTIGPYNIKKGTLIMFPFHAMHYNPKYFPEPENFIPDRFLKSSNTEIVPFSYLPFGGGPRVCIGQRFAIVEMKIAMAKLLSKFKIVNTPSTKLEALKGDPFLFSYDNVLVTML